MRDAQSLLDQVLAAFSAGARSTTCGSARFSALPTATLFDAADAVIARDASARARARRPRLRVGPRPARLTRDLLEHFRNLAVVKLGAGEPCSPSCRRKIERLSRQWRVAGDRRPAALVPHRASRDRRGGRPLLGSAHGAGDDRCSGWRQPAAASGRRVLARLDEIERDLRRAQAVRALEPLGRRPAPAARWRHHFLRPAPTRGNGGSAGVRRRIRRPPQPHPHEPPASEGRWPALLEFVQRRKLGLNLASVTRAAAHGSRRRRARRGAREVSQRAGFESDALAARGADLGVSDGAPTRVRTKLRRRSGIPAPSVTESLEHPAVQAAVEILGGEVREVRRGADGAGGDEMSNSIERAREAGAEAATELAEVQAEARHRPSRLRRAAAW